MEANQIVKGMNMNLLMLWNLIYIIQVYSHQSK